MQASVFLLVLLKLHCLKAFTFARVTEGSFCLLKHKGCQPSIGTALSTGAAGTIPRGFSVVLHAANNNNTDRGETIFESHLANDANLCTWTENNPTWDQNIAALLEYNQTYGTVNLPQYSKEYPNLGLWVFNLRLQQGRLTKEQIQQLNDIGFLWKDSVKDKNNKQWHEMFMRLKEYKEKHGDCLVSSYYPKLGQWVSFQRRLNTKGILKPERKAMLESIGFVWRLREFSEKNRQEYEDLWEKRYQELIEFKGEYNHTNVPDNFLQNKELSEWVNNQRRNKRDGTLRKDRIPRLDEIGFIWEFGPIWDDQWLERYGELKKYYQDLAKYRDVEGSKDSARPLLGGSLHSWAAGQRRMHARGNLDPQRKDMLDDIIGFEWWD